MSEAGSRSGYASARTIAEALGGAVRSGGGWKCSCPCHDDRTPSLAVWDKPGDAVPIGLKCYAGCQWVDVVRALEDRELWPKRELSEKPAATWDYHDAEGKILFQVRRYNRPDGSKYFTPFRREGDRYVKGLTFDDGRKVVSVPYRLPEILAADADEWILMPEGEKCAEACRGLEFISTTNQGGAKNWRDELSQWFRGRRVAILPDNDEAGYKRIDVVGKSLAKYAREIRVLAFDGLEAKGDVYDWIAAGGTRERLWELLDAAPIWRAGEFAERSKVVGFPDGRAMDPAPPDDVGRPTIRILPGEIGSMVDQGEEAMVNMPEGCGLYRFGRALVQIREEEIRVSGGRREKSIHTSVVTPGRLFELFSRAAMWLRYNKTQELWVSSDPPEKVPEVYLSRDGSWSVPVLGGVIGTPIVRLDGSVVDVPGYDARSGLIYEPLGWDFPRIPRSPSRRTAALAMRILMKPFELYRFETKADRAVAISGVMTAVLRRAMPVAPLHAFDGNVAGVGKSALVDVASVAATGHRAAVMMADHGRNGRGIEEAEKNLSAALLDGEQVITLDNVEDPIGGSFLNKMVTQHTVKVRVFGKLLNVTVPSIAAIFATGNNIVVFGDMTRRVLVGRVYTESADPERDTFPFEPVDLAMRKRRALVWSVLVIAKAYLGVPRRKMILGSFDEWCNLVREPIVWLLGEEYDPCRVMERTKASDPRGVALSAIAEAWEKHVGVGAQEPVRRLISIATERNGREDLGQEGELRNPELMDVLKLVADGGKSEPVSGKKLSAFLKHNRGKVVQLSSGNYRFELAQERGEGYTARWTLERVSEVSDNER